MWSRLGVRPTLIAAVLIATPTLVHAECTADFRKIEVTSKTGGTSTSNPSCSEASFVGPEPIRTAHKFA